MATDKTQTTAAAESPTNTDQPILEKATDQGYLGIKADPTPDHHYTVAGVTKGLPTPETDKGMAEKVGSQKFAHVETPGGDK